MVITVILFFMLYMLDQVLKYIINKQGFNNPIIWGSSDKSYFVKFDLTYNRGAAFGMGENSTILLTCISGVATIALIIICTKFINWKKNKVQAISLTMMLAGTFGNFYDRFITSLGITYLSDGKDPSRLNSGVVDMIYFKPFEWICDLIHIGYGVFNLADFYLVTGIILLAFDLIFFSERKKRKWEKSL